jgi:hypothetical protein
MQSFSSHKLLNMQANPRQAARTRETNSNFPNSQLRRQTTAPDPLANIQSHSMGRIIPAMQAMQVLDDDLGTALQRPFGFHVDSAYPYVDLSRTQYPHTYPVLRIFNVSQKSHHKLTSAPSFRLPTFSYASTDKPFADSFQRQLS